MQENDLFTNISKKLESDPEFRSSLITNTVETLRQHGINVPDTDVGRLVLELKHNPNEDPMNWVFVRQLIINDFP